MQLDVCRPHEVVRLAVEVAARPARVEQGAVVEVPSCFAAHVLVPAAQAPVGREDAAGGCAGEDAEEACGEGVGEALAEGFGEELAVCGAGRAVEAEGGDGKAGGG